MRSKLATHGRLNLPLLSPPPPACHPGSLCVAVAAAAAAAALCCPPQACSQRCPPPCCARRCWPSDARRQGPARRSRPPSGCCWWRERCRPLQPPSRFVGRQADGGGAGRLVVRVVLAPRAALQRYSGTAVPLLLKSAPRQDSGRSAEAAYCPRGAPEATIVSHVACQPAAASAFHPPPQPPHRRLPALPAVQGTTDEHFRFHAHSTLCACLERVRQQQAAAAAALAAEAAPPEEGEQPEQEQQEQEQERQLGDERAAGGPAAAVPLLDEERQRLVLRLLWQGFEVGVPPGEKPAVPPQFAARAAACTAWSAVYI